MMKRLTDRGWQLCMVLVACTPPNKVAEELARDEEVVATDSVDSETDTFVYGDCYAGGGELPCSVVTACELGCETNTVCLGDCRANLCMAHETIYCEMVDCISTFCDARCKDLSYSDCAVCVSLYCAASTAVCSTAGTCEDENLQTD